MNPPQPRPAPRTAAEVSQPLPLTPEAKALLTPALGVRQYLDALIAASLRVDALRVLAVALPKPEAVWWACLCVKDALKKPWTVAGEKAIEASEKWVADGSDANRRECGTAAESAGWDTAAGCVAGAAWLSGGSLAPPKLPPVAPREDLTGQTLAGALLLASVVDPKTCDATQDKFITLGLQVASGQVKRG